MMTPPSVTEGLAVRVAVVVSIESLIVVTAAAGLGVNCSKLPPVALSMVTLTVEPLL
ncbi:hypothetical protein EDP1_4198 [Pseudomonas putida S610]|nr:hypothetical protein EDP1_4198 [Pseudomonas putida S610]